MDLAKKRGIPPPGHYPAPKGDKFLLGHSDKSEKSSYHIDMAVHHSKQVPSFTYKNTESLSNLTKPRSLIAKMYEPKIKREDLAKKPKKDSGPDMGSYDSTKAYDFVQTKGLSQKFAAGPVVKFYDQALKVSKKVPGTGHYKIPDKTYTRISKSPPSIRMKRH
jgi:hypothetical protein